MVIVLSTEKKEGVDKHITLHNVSSVRHILIRMDGMFITADFFIDRFCGFLY